MPRRIVDASDAAASGKRAYASPLRTLPCSDSDTWCAFPSAYRYSGVDIDTFPLDGTAVAIVEVALEQCLRGPLC